MRTQIESRYDAALALWVARAVWEDDGVPQSREVRHRDERAAREGLTDWLSQDGIEVAEPHVTE